VKTVYLSLGSNMGNRERNLRAALERFAAAELEVLRVSPIYETEPVDLAEQGWFLNLVVEGRTDLFPRQLLARTQRIERALGRVRTVPKGPRTIDIDILLYGNAVVRGATLEIPHPRMGVRRFVLVPLADLAPDLRHPVTHRTVREMLDAAPAEIVRLADLPLGPRGRPGRGSEKSHG
jgi:2-amino-4-hydroxy-6-hydroxymethyldihydropteridine diphosphokinase